MIFKAWLGHSEYVTYLPWAITWSVLSGRLPWVAHKCNCSAYLWGNCTQGISGMKPAVHFGHVPSVTASSPHTPHTFSCLTAALVPFLKWQSRRGQKCCSCSCIFSVKMAHAHSPVVFRYGKQVWQLSRCCLTKRFQMTLKASMSDQSEVMGWEAKLTFLPSWFKASFNQHRSLEILYNIFFALIHLT